METITADELKEKLDEEEDFVLIDVLSGDSFERLRIPGSVNVPVPEIEDDASKEIPSKESEVVVYCASEACRASPRAAAKLEEMGYENVVDFEDGLAGWEEAGYTFEGEAA